MIKFRWAIYRNKVTSEHVKRYAKDMDLPLMQAREYLVNEKKRALQYDTGDGVWRDVPTEVIEL